MGKETFIDANIFLEIFFDDYKAEECERFLKSLETNDEIGITTDFLVYACLIGIENRFKDYISNPKLNNYQSIHTAVLGIDNTPTEIQIRTKEMHLFCEEGTAAHWTYKGNITEEEFDKKLTLLKRSLEQDIISVDFFTENIYISTPKGKIIELPKGATVLDFAYAIHSDVGEKCIGAKINEKFENIKTELKNGDSVEIITSKTQSPSKDWLSFVVTEKARSKIRHFLRGNDGTILVLIQYDNAVDNTLIK